MLLTVFPVWSVSMRSPGSGKEESEFLDTTCPSELKYEAKYSLRSRGASTASDWTVRHDVILFTASLQKNVRLLVLSLTSHLKKSFIEL